MEIGQSSEVKLKAETSRGSDFFPLPIEHGFICDVCNQSFSLKMDLTNHQSKLESRKSFGRNS